MHLEKPGGYFWLSNDRKQIAVIVHIQLHPFPDDRTNYLATPNYPRMKWLAAQGKSPQEAFNVWHQKHIEYIHKFLRNN